MNWRIKFPALFRREKLDADMAEEMRAHVELQTQANLKAGMPPDEARYAALRQFGGLEQIKEQVREQRGWGWIGDFAQDFRFGARALRKNPGFTFVAVVTLALGIGVNTSIFTLFNGFVLRPPRVGDPRTLVSIFARDKRNPSTSANAWATTPYRDYVFYRDQNRVFTGLAAAILSPVTLGGAVGADGPASTAEEQQIFAQLVSGNYFDVLGGHAALGRTFLPEEDRVPDAQPVVVLHHKFWERQFGADPSIVGKTLTLNGRAFTIVGVAAADFGGNRMTEPDVWTPMMMAAQIKPGLDLSSLASAYVDMLGRLEPGVTLAQAQAQMDLVAGQNLAAQPDSNMLGLHLRPVALGNNGDAQSWSILMLVMGVVLLLVSANVANLSLARASRRYREIGVRLTLGASRGRLVRQLLTESALLGLLGGGLGLLVAAIAPRLLFVTLQRLIAPLLPIDVLLGVDFHPDLRILGYTFGVSLVTGLFVGLAPALQSTKLDLLSALKDEGTLFGRQISRSRLRNLLVVVQVAACLVLLVGAALLVRGLQKVQNLDLGFDLGHLLVVRQDLRAHGYNAARRTEFLHNLSERLRQQPGVQAVGWAFSVPLQGGSENGAVRLQPGDPVRYFGFNLVSPEFFSALGIPILQGRDFSEQDTGQNRSVVIVNEAFARRFWPGEDPVGREIIGIENRSEVVGVVRNARIGSLGNADEPMMYFVDRPLVRGSAGGNESMADRSILIRTEGDPRLAVAGVRDAIQTLDHDLRPTIRTLSGNLDLQLMQSRVGAWLAGALGLLALAVTAIGLYGVIAYATNQRTHEIGIRMALGASPADVIRLVLGQGWRLVSLGVSIGIVGAVALGAALGKILYGVSPFDPVALGSGSLLLAGVATLACWLPARRAARINPTEALHCE